jgi:hypothetical protein
MNSARAGAMDTTSSPQITQHTGPVRWTRGNPGVDFPCLSGQAHSSYLGRERTHYSIGVWASQAGIQARRRGAKRVDSGPAWGR